jgi:peptidyl-prolyl cis-trans isomerase D
MLKKMRKNVKHLSIFLWIVVFSFVFFIFVDWGSGRFGPNANMDTIAWVKKSRILTPDFRRTLFEREDMMKKKYGEKAREYTDNPQFPQTVLQQMIRELMLTINAEELGIRASDEEVSAKVLSYPVFKDKNGNFVGYNRYKQTLAYFHMTIPQFEDSIRKEIIINKLQNYITSGITATPEEAYEEYKNEKENFKTDYYLIKTSEVNYDKEITKDELKQYFKLHHKEFRIPEKRSIKYIVFQTKNYEKNVKIADSDIKKYYDENIERFKQPEKRFIKRIFIKKGDNSKKKIEDALKSLKAGKDFSELAKTLSEDKKAKQGGDWGSMEWLYFLPQKEKQEIVKLSKDSISDIIETNDGYAILYLYNYTPAKTSTFEEVKNRIEQYIKYQKTQELVLKEAKKYLKKVGKKSLEEFGKKNKLIVKEAKDLSSVDTIASVDPSGSVTKAIFALKKPGDKTKEPIFTYSGAVIAELTKISKEREAKFDEVDDKVKEAFLNNKKRELALQIAKDINNKLKNNEKIEATLPYLEKKEDIEINHSGYVKGIGYIKPVEEFGFKAPVGAISKPIFTEKGYIILIIKSKNLITKTDFEKDKDKYIKQLTKLKKDNFFSSYMQKLVKRYKVKINNYVLETFTKKGK